jgi:hypothetical protein
MDRDQEEAHRERNVLIENLSLNRSLDKLILDVLTNRERYLKG